MEEDIRKPSLKIDNFNSSIIRDINMSGLQVGEIYYVLKSIFKDIENLYNKQVEAEYKEFCEEAKKEGKEQEEETEIVEEKEEEKE